MSDDKLPDGVTVFPPDPALRKKIGDVDLDKVFTPQVVQAAQQVVTQAADTLMDEVRQGLDEMKAAVAPFEAGGAERHEAFWKIAEKAFYIRTRAGFGQYHLVSSVAKSLQAYAESLDSRNVTGKDVEIIKWHVQSLDMLLTKDIKGDGGDFGKALMAEIGKIIPARAEG